MMLASFVRKSYIAIVYFVMFWNSPCIYSNKT